MTIRKGYVDTRWGQVHYRQTPLRDGLPLVLLHQTASSSVMFEALMDELGSGYGCLAPDTPGFGGSFQNEGSPTVKFWSDSLYEALIGIGIKECWLFGHHTGASIAVQLEHDHPGFARKLILSGPPYLSSEQQCTFKSNLYRITLQPDGSHLLPVWERIAAKEPNVPLVLAHREAVLTLQVGQHYHEAYEAVFDHGFADQLQAIQCPTLVMAGEFDALKEYLEPACAALPNGRLRYLPGAGTYVCERQTHVVANIIREFFFD